MFSYNTRPLVSIVIPVFNNSTFLNEAILSALGQTYPHTEVIVQDDCSTDQKVRRILSKYSGSGTVKIFFSPVNEGIAMATNRAIINSSGEYIAFLDCDDILPKHSIETVVMYINKYPAVDYFYSNRELIEASGKVYARFDCSGYSSEPAEKVLMRYMFASHLKVIKRACFLAAGLHKKVYDTCQDYDMALRLSECFRFMHIPEYLYRYRTHKSQVSETRVREQAKNAYRARDMAVVRRQLFFNRSIGTKKISIIMLTMNRLKRTASCLNRLYASTGLPFELIVVDNNSGPEMKKYLRELTLEKNNVRVFFEPVNLGCAGGRKKGVAAAEGDFVVTLDNDCEPQKYWLENLLFRVAEEPDTGGVCARVVLPGGVIQYNGGLYSIEKNFIRLSFMDQNKSSSDLSSLLERDCQWLPGGATLFRRSVYEKVGLNSEMDGGFEDVDFSLRVANAGFRMVNCPTAVAIHHHITLEPENYKDPLYFRQRYNPARILEALILFYREHRLVIHDPWLFDYLGIPHGTPLETLEYFKGASPGHKPAVKHLLLSNPR